MTGSLAMLAMAEAAQPPAWAQFVPILLIFGVFYLLLVAPMRKRQKALDQLLAGLKKGDKVVTTGGLHGEIAKIDDDQGIVQLKLSENVKVRVNRSAIAGLAGQPQQGAGK